MEGSDDDGHGGGVLRFEGAGLVRAPALWTHRQLDVLAGRLTAAAGGPARRRAVVLLGSTNALDAADKGVVAAVALQLEQAFHVGTTDIGLLVTVSSLVGALGTLPFGAVADRVNRTKLLRVSVLLWAVAEVAGGLSTSFMMLIATRVLLGVLTAAAPPTVASLSGDLFPSSERGRLLGFVLSGEVLGTGAGVLLASLVSQFAGWRGAVIVLSLGSPVLWLALRRMLPEPARGGQSQLLAGDEQITGVRDARDRPRGREQDGPPADQRESLVRHQIEEAGVEPAEEIVPDGTPKDMTLRQAVRYVLRIKTNVILIVAGSLGYFFFGGLRTFGILFVRGRYDVGQGLATAVVLAVGIGTLVGVLTGGRVADRFLRRGRLTARITVAGIAYLGALAFLAPGLLCGSLAVAVPLYVLAAIALSAPNPPLDAARLDVVSSRLWGRAEGVRSVLRSSLEAFAPLVFGFVASLLGAGGVSLGSGVNSRHAAVSSAQATGLEYAFLLMLIPLGASALLLLRARRTYPTDVASAVEADRRQHRTSSLARTGD